MENPTKIWMIWWYPHDYNGNLPEPHFQLPSEKSLRSTSPMRPAKRVTWFSKNSLDAQVAICDYETICIWRFPKSWGYLQIDPNHPFCWDVPLQTIHVGDPPFMETSIYIYISYIWCTFRYVSCIYLNRRIYVHTQPLWLWFRWWFFDVPIWWCCNLPWLGNPLSFTFIFFWEG